MEQSLLHTGAGILKWDNFFYKLRQALQSGGKYYHKVGLIHAITQEDKSYSKIGTVNLQQSRQSLLQSGQVLKRETTLLNSDITRWDSYYKVGQYIDQRYIKKFARNLLPYPIPFIFLLGTRVNGCICLQTGPKWFESRVV